MTFCKSEGQPGRVQTSSFLDGFDGQKHGLDVLQTPISCDSLNVLLRDALPFRRMAAALTKSHSYRNVCFPTKPRSLQGMHSTEFCTNQKASLLAPDWIAPIWQEVVRKIIITSWGIDSAVYLILGSQKRTGSLDHFVHPNFCTGGI